MSKVLEVQFRSRSFLMLVYLLLLCLCNLYHEDTFTYNLPIYEGNKNIFSFIIYCEDCRSQTIAAGKISLYIDSCIKFGNGSTEYKIIEITESNNGTFRWSDTLNNYIEERENGFYSDSKLFGLFYHPFNECTPDTYLLMPSTFKPYNYWKFQKCGLESNIRTIQPARRAFVGITNLDTKFGSINCYTFETKMTLEALEPDYVHDTLEIYLHHYFSDLNRTIVIKKLFRSQNFPLTHLFV